MEDFNTQESQNAPRPIEGNDDHLITSSTEGNISDLSQATSIIAFQENEKEKYAEELNSAKKDVTFQKTKVEAVAVTLSGVEVQSVQLNTEINHVKVLVVEDIALNQLLMKTLLDDFGFECDIAENGKIAIEKLQTNSYDIILMDLQMPEMNGFEATEYIRNTMNSNIPIVAVTANVTTIDLAKCKAVGMNDYMAKPVDEIVLYNKIIGLVKKPVVANIKK